MGFSNRSRKNTRIQKKNRLKRTPEARVMAVWSFTNSKVPSTFKMLNFQTAVSLGSNVRLTQIFFWILVFLRELFEKSILLVRISFYFFHHVPTRIRISKRRFLEKRLAQTAFRQFVCVDIEKIRGFKKKIASIGHPRPELWPFEVQKFKATFNL